MKANDLSVDDLMKVIAMSNDNSHGTSFNQMSGLGMMSVKQIFLLSKPYTSPFSQKSG